MSSGDCGVYVECVLSPIWAIESNIGWIVQRDERERNNMDSHRRSIAKAVSWRVLALIITGSVAWAITGELHFAVYIGAVDSLIKLGMYYGHERVWNRISFGRPPAA